MSEIKEETKSISTTRMICPECESESMELARVETSGLILSEPSPMLTIRFICGACQALQIENYIQGRSGYTARFVSVVLGRDYWMQKEPKT